MLDFLNNKGSVIVGHLEGREGEGRGKGGFWAGGGGANTRGNGGVLGITNRF